MYVTFTSGLIAFVSLTTTSAALALRPVKMMCSGLYFASVVIVSLPSPAVPPKPVSCCSAVYFQAKYLTPSHEDDLVRQIWNVRVGIVRRFGSHAVNLAVACGAVQGLEQSTRNRWTSKFVKLYASRRSCAAFERDLRRTIHVRLLPVIYVLLALSRLPAEKDPWTQESGCLLQ